MVPSVLGGQMTPAQEIVQRINKVTCIQKLDGPLVLVQLKKDLEPASMEELHGALTQVFGDSFILVVVGDVFDGIKGLGLQDLIELRKSIDDLIEEHAGGMLEVEA